MKILEDLHVTKDAACELVTSLAPRNGATIVALYGDLGSGKTSFVQGAARALGIEESIISPTYVIEKIYRIPEGQPWRNFVHIDAYRLENERELAALGWDDVVADPANIVFLEWAEKAEALLPHDVVKVRLGHQDERCRTLEVMYG